jgi:hypothetical protein
MPEPEDPNSLIRQVLEMGDEFPGPAGDVLLSWLLDLKERVAPALAVRRLIERHGLPGLPSPIRPWMNQAGPAAGSNVGAPGRHRLVAAQPRAGFFLKLMS